MTTLSPEQIRQRIGCLTASRIGDVLAVKKDGKPTAARLDYMKQLVAERMTDVAAEFYVTGDMQWGIDQEDCARQVYEAETGAIVIECGSVPHPRIEHALATPDGLVGADGMIEIKCPKTTTYVGWLLNGGVPEQHKAQMLWQIACTGRKWCDFIAFDPRIVKGPKVMIRRFEPKADEIAKIESEAVRFLDEVEALFQQVTEREYS